jgi:hypothetical protein
VAYALIQTSNLVVHGILLAASAGPREVVA